MVNKKAFIFVLAIVVSLMAFTSAWQDVNDDDDDDDDDATYERGADGNKKGHNFANRVMKTLERFGEKLNDFEARFNKSLADLQTSTTAPATQYYYNRHQYMQQTWTPWVPPTTTLSPKEKCLANQDVLCYDDQCVKADKLCDGVKDCSDESDEFFCKPDAPETLKPISKCPSGFVGSVKLDKCYFFAKEKPLLNWISAVVDCAKRNAKLVSIRSRLEQEAIMRYLKTYESLSNSSFWIGATSILKNTTDTYWLMYSNPNVNKQWTWIPARIGQVTETLADVGFSFWKNQQPDAAHGANEFCLEMRGDFNWQWNDQECANQNLYICETA